MLKLPATLWLNPNILKLSTSTYYSSIYSTTYETLTITVNDEPTLTPSPTRTVTKAKTTTTTTTISSSTTTSLKSKCGPNFNNQKCSNDECCSSHGRCGRSDDHCKIENGCQSEFGRCDYSHTESYIVSEISLKGKCGPKFNYKKCSNDECCSIHGRCGRSDDHCKLEDGCQSEFGKCN